MRINWLIGLASVLVFIPFFYLRFIRYKQLSKLEKRQNKIWDREYGHFWEVISNIRLVKTFATERYELNKFRNVTGKLYQNNLKMEAINNKGTGADLLIDLWTAAIYAYIFHLGLTGQYTIGLVVLLISYVEMIKQPLWNLSWIFWEVKYAMIGSSTPKKTVRMSFMASVSRSNPAKPSPWSANPALAKPPLPTSWSAFMIPTKAAFYLMASTFGTYLMIFFIGLPVWSCRIVIFLTKLSPRICAMVSPMHPGKKWQSPAK